MPCPECRGRGYVCLWNGPKWNSPATRIDCGWCKGAKEIDPDVWVDYQPHRQRPKARLDIQLMDGTVLKRTWPNGLNFSTNRGHISDMDVKCVRLSSYEHP